MNGATIILGDGKRISRKLYTTVVGTYFVRYNNSSYNVVEVPDEESGMVFMLANERTHEDVNNEHNKKTVDGYIAEMETTEAEEQLVQRAIDAGCKKTVTDIAVWIWKYAHVSFDDTIIGEIMDRIASRIQPEQDEEAMKEAMEGNEQAEIEMKRQEAEKLAAEIEHDMGEKYITLVSQYENTSEFLVGLWTRQENPPDWMTTPTDKIVCTFSMKWEGTSKWELFKQAARDFVKNEEIKRFEEDLVGGYYDEKKEEWVDGLPSTYGKSDEQLIKEGQMSPEKPVDIRDEYLWN